LLVVAGVVLLVIGITTLVNLRKDVGEAIARVFVHRTERQSTAIVLTVVGGVALVVGGTLLALARGKPKKRR